MPRRPPLSPLLLLPFLAACATPAPSPGPVPAAAGDAVATVQEHTLRDRVVAVVDEEVLLLSDVEMVIALGLVERRDGERRDALRERALDGLIRQRLRYQEAERFGFGRVSVEEIERQVEGVADNFDSRDALRARLAELGLTEAELRQLMARQLMVLNYVDERLGARVFVSLDDIRSYYENELVPRLSERGQEAPPLADVREEIRALLKERRLNEEVERWTEELLREADVQTFLDEPLEELPPLRDRLSG